MWKTNSEPDAIKRPPPIFSTIILYFILDYFVIPDSYLWWVYYGYAGTMWLGYAAYITYEKPRRRLARQKRYKISK